MGLPAREGSPVLRGPLARQERRVPLAPLARQGDKDPLARRERRAPKAPPSVS